MKLLSKVTLGLVTAALLLAGCNEGTKVTAASTVKADITEESLGLRKTNLYSEAETVAAKTQYTTAAAGSSNKIARAFQDAPPMIPHDVSGFLPIKAKNNACIGCHAPDIAPAMGATPIPGSHFLDMRPKHKFDGKMFSKVIDNYKNETSVKKINHLSSARFNCSQCHAPQSQGTLAVENTFEATYTRPDGASKSSWEEVIYDSLDTVGDKSFVTEEDIANKNSAAGSLAGVKKH